MNRRTFLRVVPAAVAGLAVLDPTKLLAVKEQQLLCLVGDRHVPGTDDGLFLHLGDVGYPDHDWADHDWGQAHFYSDWYVRTEHGVRRIL